MVIISSSSSFFKISITWDPPEIRNGIIIAYEVSYRPASDPQTITTMNTTDLDTSFTTESGLQLGTAYIFTVTAFTGAGRGEIATASISTLARPRKIRALCLTSTHTDIQYSYDISFIQCMYVYSHSLTAAVQGVEVTALNATAVTVSWNALVIPDFPDFSIDHYTVLYSRVESQRRRRQDGTMSAQFPSTATSGVIAGLDSIATYQFQVFATGTADGTPLQGERSSPVNFIFTIDGEYNNYHYHNFLPSAMSDHIYYICIIPDSGDGGTDNGGDGAAAGSNIGGIAGGAIVAVIGVLAIVGIAVMVVCIVR